MKAVGLYLRGLREERGITQAGAARQIGLAPKTIERWEAGTHEPTLTNLRPYIDLVGGSPERVVQLLFDKEMILSESDFIAIAKLTPEKKRLALELIDQLSRVS